MMHVMNPGVNESANKFRGPRSQSLPVLSPWAQQQAVQLVGQPLMSQQPQNAQFGQMHPQQYQVPITGATVPASVMEAHKRMRGPNDVPPQPLAVDDDCVQQQHGKRSRGNAYRAPRDVKPTVNSVMGSLVGGSLRRQLSGSQLDQFMSQGDNDKMDEDDNTPATRERAMSF